MPHDELIALLTRARAVLDRHMFEEGGELMRDDVASVCMAIDDVLPGEERVQPRKVSLERSAA